MYKIAIIGAGGINSWTIKNLTEMFVKLDITDYLLTIFDNDIVEEKNIINQNQNFQAEDVMDGKAESLAKKYAVMFKNQLITEENIDCLDNYNVIILGVDNNKARKMIYQYALDKNKYLLDMKAQGTQISYIVLEHTKGMEYYNNKYFNNEEVMERKGSCQLQKDIDNNHVEMGNYIIACLGINACLLKHIRNEKPSTFEWRFAY